MTHDVSMNQTLLDYYKCPEEVCDLETKSELSRKNGFFQFGPGTICYGRSRGSRSRPAKCPTGELFDASLAVEIDHGVVRLPFDLSEAVENLRRERFMGASETSPTLRNLRTIKHDIYYFFRPWMPVSIRKYLQRLNLHGWQHLRFPHWPVDHTVDTILEHVLVLCMKAKGISSLPFIWFWPDGAPSCAMMTHDVETSAGVDCCRELASLDDSFGVKSSFQFVPEERYVVPSELLDELRSRGFEIDIQDLNHDGDLFRDRGEFLRRAARINEHLRNFRSKGFRSAILYRNADWLKAIEASYDMSFPSVAHLEPQRGGCCTVMPFFIDNVLELPLTTTQDYSLLHILDEYSLDIWKRQIDLIRQRNGLISFIVHPDYLEGKREIELYRSLLSHLSCLRAKEKLWIALPGEIDRWWRARKQMKLVSRNGQWHIEGECSERACIAYANLVGDRITYTW
jgi:hypothetical protein